MATFIGTLIPSPHTGEGHIPQGLRDLRLRYTRSSSVLGSPINGGAFTETTPLPLPEKTHAGAYVRTFGDDWYDMIHVNPARINVGNIVNSQTYDVTVWNAYRSDQELSVLQLEGGDGISINEPVPTPTTFAALEARTYEIVIGLDGPPTIDALIEFTFPTDSPDIVVSGSRVVVFPFSPNWSGGVRERISWLTDVIEAYDGSEQRIQLRSLPRRRWEYDAVVYREAVQWLDAILWAWQARLYALPVWTDPSLLQTAVMAGATELQLDTTGRDFRAGGNAILLRDERYNEAVQIDSVESYRLVLGQGTELDWPVGARVYPSRLVRLTDEQTVSNETAAVSRLSVQFDADELETDAEADAPDRTHRGLPVSVQEPNRADAVQASYRRRLEELDSRTAGVVRADRTGRPRVQRQHEYVLDGRGAIAEFRRWVHAQKGRLKTAYVPTWQQDLTLTAIIGLGATQITVRDVGYGSFYALQMGRSDLALQLYDGTWFFREIVGFGAPGNGQQQIEVASTFGQQIHPSDVRRLCWLERVRLAGDSVELDWRTAGVAVAEVTWEGVDE